MWHAQKLRCIVRDVVYDRTAISSQLCIDLRQNEYASAGCIQWEVPIMQCIASPITDMVAMRQALWVDPMAMKIQHRRKHSCRLVDVGVITLQGKTNASPNNAR